MMTPSNASPKTDSMQIPQVIEEILRSRGVAERGEMERFLFPQLSDLPQPHQMKNLHQAAQTIADFMAGQLPIYIWGDYDVDGTTGTALLVNFFHQFGVQVEWHIPNRLTDGYGVNKDWFLQRASELQRQPFLLITVDCGISNREEVGVINRLGGTVVVTDHHMIAGSLPPCLVVNPSQQDCGFHQEKLAGVGVAFYLAAAVRKELTRKPGWTTMAESIRLKDYLSFVALGTIADLVAITPTNRILVRAGLEALATRPFTGLEAFLQSTDIGCKDVSTEDIAYYLAPRINAAGRLGNSRIVVELLTANDRQKADHLAEELSRLNLERRNICLENFELAIQSVDTAAANRMKCVTTKGHYHPGVAGIVASRLVDLYGFPALVLCQSANDDTHWVGSIRSTEGVNILEALIAAGEFADKFGGHEMAAGVTLHLSRIEMFLARFSAEVRKLFSKRTVLTRKVFHCPVDTVMDSATLRWMQLLEPFGPGNEQPIFVDKDAYIVDAKRVGRGAEHLQVMIRGKFSNWKGIGFHHGKELEDIQKSPVRQLRFTATKNRYRGTVSWQVRVIDI